MVVDLLKEDHNEVNLHVVVEDPTEMWLEEQKVRVKTSRFCSIEHGRIQTKARARE